MSHAKLGYRLRTPGDGGGFVVRGDVWNVYLLGMSRVGNATYWHLSIVGHRRTHTLTIKAANTIWSLTPPDHLLEAVREWLATGRRDRFAVAELVEI